MHKAAIAAVAADRLDRDLPASWRAAGRKSGATGRRRRHQRARHAMIDDIEEADVATGGADRAGGSAVASPRRSLPWAPRSMIGNARFISGTSSFTFSSSQGRRGNARRPPVRDRPRRPERQRGTAFSRDTPPQCASGPLRGRRGRVFRPGRLSRPATSSRATCAAVARAKTRSIGSTGMIASRSSGRGRARECRRARRPSSAPSPGAPLAKRPLATIVGEPVAALDDVIETPAAVQEMAEPHFAQDVVVLVEGRGVDADRDAAAALDRFADRRDAAREMQVGTRVRGDRPRRTRAIRSRSSRARMDAMGERQARRQKPERLQPLRRRPRDRRASAKARW